MSFNIYFRYSIEKMCQNRSVMSCLMITVGVQLKSIDVYVYLCEAGVFANLQNGIFNLRCKVLEEFLVP